MVVAKRSRQGPRNTGERRVGGAEWEPEATPAALLAGPVDAGQAPGEKENVRGAKDEPARHRTCRGTPSFPRLCLTAAEICGNGWTAQFWSASEGKHTVRCEGRPTQKTRREARAGQGRGLLASPRVLTPGLSPQTCLRSIFGGSSPLRRLARAILDSCLLS